MTSNHSSISSLAFSANEEYLAAGDNSGKIVLYETASGSVKTSRWQFQSATITSMSWHAGGTLLASSSMDTSICVYSVESPMKYTISRNAHKDGVVGIEWHGESKLYSAGRDAAVKEWIYKR
jgi:WD40 repeat protein